MSSARTRPYSGRYSGRNRMSKKKTFSNSKSSYTTLATGPKVLTRKLRYVTNIIINPGAASDLAEHLFSANGCFDPDVTGTGHQPLGFDQHMLFYDHYKVKSSKLTASILPSTFSEVGYVAGIYLDDNNTASTDSNNLIEQGLTSYKVMTAGTGVQAHVIKKSFNALNFFSKNQVNTNSMIGTESANPSDQAYFKVFLQSINTGSVDVGATKLLIVIDYIVDFFERKTLASS